MPTQRPFLSRFILILLVAVIGISACTWTNLIFNDQPDQGRGRGNQITQGTTATETPTPAKPVAQDDVSGTWIGSALLNDGTQLSYHLELIQDGSTLTGTSGASNEEGAATVSVSGTYEDGNISLKEYGVGERSGEWEDICYWSIELHTRGTGSDMRLVGTFKDLPNSAGTCTLMGELTLMRQ